MVFYENILSEMIQADILECLTPNSTASMPFRIFNSSLHAAMSAMKRRWKHKRLQLENIVYMQQQQLLHQQLQLQQQRSLSSTSSESRGPLLYPPESSSHIRRLAPTHQPPIQSSMQGGVYVKPRMGPTPTSHSSSHVSSNHHTRPSLHSDAQQLFNTISSVVFSGSSGNPHTLPSAYTP